jgi:HTH-type transcriptional regulator/antitoxin HigA
MEIRVMSITELPSRSYLDLVRQFPLRPLRSRNEYDRAAAILDQLAVQDEADLDEGETDYLDTLSLLIEAYDRDHFPMPVRKRSPVELLKFLMEQNQMSTTDLGKLLGSKGLASEILHGKRELSKTHIRKLAKRFGLDPGLFF